MPLKNILENSKIFINILKNNYSKNCTYPQYIVDLKTSFSEFKDIVKNINYF